MKIGPAQSIGDGTFLTKVWQGHDDAVDAVSIAPEKIGATPRLFAGLDRTVLALFCREGDNIDASRSQNTQNLFAATLGQMVRKETTVANNQPHGHFSGRHTAPRSKRKFYDCRCGTNL